MLNYWYILPLFKSVLTAKNWKWVRHFHSNNHELSTQKHVARKHVSPFSFYVYIHTHKAHTRISIINSQCIYSQIKARPEKIYTDSGRQFSIIHIFNFPQHWLDEFYNTHYTATLSSTVEMKVVINEAKAVFNVLLLKVSRRCFTVNVKRIQLGGLYCEVDAKKYNKWVWFIIKTRNGSS